MTRKIHLSHQSIGLFDLHSFQMQSPILTQGIFLQTEILFYEHICIDVGQYQLSKLSALLIIFGWGLASLLPQ